MPQTPERRRERRREQYANDPEYHARADAYHAAWVAKNRARVNARKRAAYAANPEPVLTRQRAYRAANAAEVKAKQRIRDARRDPEKLRVQQMYSKRGITPGEWVEIRTAQNGQCYLCGTEVPAEPCRNAVVDHDHRCCGPQKSCPSCRRGIACRRCNSIIGLAGDDPEVLRMIADRLQAVLAVQAQRLAIRRASMVPLFELTADDEPEGINA